MPSPSRPLYVRTWAVISYCESRPWTGIHCHHQTTNLFLAWLLWVKVRLTGVPRFYRVELRWKDDWE